MLKVYGASASPFVRKVLIALEYKGVPYEQIFTSPFAPPPDWQTLSPMKKIPVLQDGDLALPDSTIICRYLEDIHPTPPLYPADTRARARACWLEEYGDTGLAEVAGTYFFERVAKVHLLGQQPDEARIAKFAADVQPGVLAYVESVVPTAGYVAADHLTIADIAIICPLLNGMMGGFALDAAQYPKLAAYFARVTALPVFKARAEKEAAEMKALIG